MKKLGCFLLFACFLIAVPAYADGDLTLFGAAQHQGKLTLQAAQSAATTPTNFNPGTFGAFGIRFGHGKILGGEHTFAYAPNFLTNQSKAIIYNSDILVQAPLPKIRPYGTAGLGTVFSWGTDSSGQPALSKIGTKFALNYGAGLKVFPAGPIGVRFDIRGYIIPNARFNLPSAIVHGQVISTTQSQSQTLNMLEVGLGVVFKF
jgi:Outer membrane protein beta-barrel domain